MTTDTERRILQAIAAEIGASPAQVGAAVGLLDEGATVPFVARYRKEATGGLDDTQLRTLSERLAYLREMEARRAAIAQSITEQGKMTDALALSIQKAATKAELEDIYLPYKPKRRTRAMIARENGLQPLLDAILADRNTDPAALADATVDLLRDDAARARLCDPQAEVSAHWLISETGTTEALVDERHRAWHAGAGGWAGLEDINSHSIGIELANDGQQPFSEPQMAALERLLTGILARWPIPPCAQ